jgi:hypothetical protein
MITNTVSLFLPLEITLDISFVVMKEKTNKSNKIVTKAHKISKFYPIFLRQGISIADIYGNHILLHFFEWCDLNKNFILTYKKIIICI